MTVKELIEKLQALPQDRDVLVNADTSHAHWFNYEKEYYYLDDAIAIEEWVDMPPDGFSEWGDTISVGVVIVGALEP